MNTASQQALAQAGSPAVAAWIGSVTDPPARSSADCRNAALAMEQAAASVSALWSGTYKGNRTSFASDVWPGDALLLNAPSTSLNAQVVVRTVKVSYSASYPDLVEYAISFANDWADDLAIKTSTTVPADTWLPAAINPTVLANLTNLTVTTLNGTTVAMNAGVTPPAGGGFEIRLRDFAFMPGEDPTLVVRANLPNMTFSRMTANDRFYIRMCLPNSTTLAWIVATAVRPRQDSLETLCNIENGRSPVKCRAGPAGVTRWVVRAPVSSSTLVDQLPQVREAEGLLNDRRLLFRGELGEAPRVGVASHVDDPAVLVGGLPKTSRPPSLPGIPGQHDVREKQLDAGPVLLADA